MDVYEKLQDTVLQVIDKKFEEFKEEFKKEVEEKYPSLLDPTTNHLYDNVQAVLQIGYLHGVNVTMNIVIDFTHNEVLKKETIH